MATKNIQLCNCITVGNHEVKNDPPDDAWNDINTKAILFENQARAEHFEYHNLRIAKARHIAACPSTDESLIYAYQVLASAESDIHHSSHAGEITNALKYLLDAVGTSSLIDAAKEQARWCLDERHYRNDKRRSHIDSWLAVLFGFVGSAGLADVSIHPVLNEMQPHWKEAYTGLLSFLLALGFTLSVASLIWAINRIRQG